MRQLNCLDRVPNFTPLRKSPVLFCDVEIRSDSEEILPDQDQVSKLLENQRYRISVEERGLKPGSPVSLTV